jgi:signal peptide peptidase-like protein 2B
MLLLFVVGVTATAANEASRFAGQESPMATATIRLPDLTALHPSPIVAFNDASFNSLSSLPFKDTLQVTLVRQKDGCQPASVPFPTKTPFALVVDRGNCTFGIKLKHAKQAGASAVLVLNRPASLLQKDKVLVDMCSVYAHRSSQGDIICDQDKTCSDTGKIDFKFTKKDTQEARCCLDVARSLNYAKSLDGDDGDDVNTTIPFLFLSIPDAVVLQNAILSNKAALTVQILHRDPGFDFASLCIWSIGVLAVFVSCYFAAAKERKEAYKRFWLPLGDQMMQPMASSTNQDDEDEEEPVEVLTWKHAVAMLLCSFTMLLLLYGLIKAGFAAMVLVMQIFFGYAATVATYKILFYPCFKHLCPTLHSTKRTVELCGERNTCPTTVPLAIVAALTTAAVWGITRHAAWNWVLLDCLGLCVCCLIVSTMRIAGLRAATILLVLFFFYDIFMVFITVSLSLPIVGSGGPVLFLFGPFSHLTLLFSLSSSQTQQPSIFGDSVMVEVATGGGANLPSTTVQNTTNHGASGVPGGGSVMTECVRKPGENIPMLYMFPRLTGWTGGYSMLGYGDVIFPSLLLSHVLRFDYKVRGRLCCWKHGSMDVGDKDQTRPGSPCKCLFGWVVGWLVGWFGLFVVFLLSSFLIVFCVLFVYFVFCFSFVNKQQTFHG